MKYFLIAALTLLTLNSIPVAADDDEAKDHKGMQEMEHKGMKGMEHKGMQGMEHKCMQGMEHKCMQGMEHKCMQGMDHKGMQEMEHKCMKGMDHHSASGEASHGGGEAHGGSHTNSAGTPLPPTDFVDAVFNVTLLDTMKIEYDKHLDIKAGNVVKFIVTNKGKLRHEFSISNAEEQIAHVQMMREMPNMQHDDGTTISIESGETAEMVWKFDGETKVVFSCNIPGHSEAGMLTQVSLVGANGHHAHYRVGTN